MVSSCIGGACIGFTLTHSYVTDNLLLYVAPDDTYCRACFLRIFLSQMMQTVKTPSLAPAALELAHALDNDTANNERWHVYAVREKTHVVAFELVPYQDCPVCSRPAPVPDEQAALEYATRLDRIAAAHYDGLRGRIFSFGFARRLTVDRVTGLPDPRYDKLLGENYAARILPRASIAGSSSRQGTGWTCPRWACRRISLHKSPPPRRPQIAPVQGRCRPRNITTLH